MIRIAAAAGATALIISAVALFAPGQAKSAVSVFGSGFAEQCFHVARDGGDVYSGISDCTRAIDTEMLDTRDRAGTYVNRGVLHMAVNEFVEARHDFEMGVKLDPTLGEGFVNLGGVKIAQHQYAEGIADIDHGLQLTPEEPEKAYYNRALGDEGLDDIKAAYFDYSKAAELKPTWAAPRIELARFTVRPAP